MTSIKIAPHTNTIPITFKIGSEKKVVLLSPSNHDFTFDLPENAQLIGEFGLEPMTVDSVSGSIPERLG